MSRLEGAACYGLPTEWWFPDSHEDEWQETKERAKAICAKCPAQADCLDWALRHEDHGIWGGQTERERRATRKAQGIVLDIPTVDPPRHGTPAAYRRCQDDNGRPCGACRRAETLRVQQYPKIPDDYEMPPHNCGTIGGYAALLRFFQRTGVRFDCEPCRAASAAQGRQWIRDNPEKHREAKSRQERRRHRPKLGRGPAEGEWLY